MLRKAEFGDRCPYCNWLLEDHPNEECDNDLEEATNAFLEQQEALEQHGEEE